MFGVQPSGKYGVRSVLPSVEYGVRSVHPSVKYGVRSVLPSVKYGVRSVLPSVKYGVRSVLILFLLPRVTLLSSVFCYKLSKLFGNQTFSFIINYKPPPCKYQN